MNGIGPKLIPFGECPVVIKLDGNALGNNSFIETTMHIIRGDQIEFVPATHEDPVDPGVWKKVLATKNQLIKGRVQMVNWSRLPVGKSFQPHFHEDMQEVFIIINGAVEMTISGTTCELVGGDAVLISPREIHEMKNVCDREVDYIVFGISTESGGQTVNVNTVQ